MAKITASNVKENRTGIRRMFDGLEYAGNHSNKGKPDCYGYQTATFTDNDGNLWEFSYDPGQWDNVDVHSVNGINLY
jgi:uncharacterized glyoxalase superfamily protein PhnB